MSLRDKINEYITDLETRTYCVGAGQRPSVDAQELVDTLKVWLSEEGDN